MTNSISQNSTRSFGRCALPTLTLLIFATTVATAQTRTSIDGKCGKPDQVRSIEVGDRAGHALMLLKVSCTFANSMEMASVRAKDYVVTQTFDSVGPESGYAVVTLDNGDKAFVRFTGTNGEGTWSYVGGTGKLKDITGKGTYKSTGTADGFESHFEGEYTLEPPPPPKIKK